MAQLFAIIAQLLATIVKHRPTVFQFCQRLINCLPITCHFDHQIKSVKFSWFFVFLSKKCVFVFFVFHRWSAGSFAAESIGNLNMNGSNVWCMVRLYILCSDYDCIPFFLILSSDTREKVCSCVFKNSPRFFFFVFPFLFLLLFAGHQKKLLNSHGLNISGSGPEENSHSTAPMNDCSKNVHFKFNALEGHANFQNATILEALEKNAAKNFQLTPARQLPRMLTFVSL